MSNERDEDQKEDPAEQLKQGIGLLWRAARGMAVSVKKEMDKTDLGRSLEDAGREIARAASNVADRIVGEVTKKPGKPEPKAPDVTTPREESEDDEFDGVKAPKKKPTGPTPEDPGFSIMTDDDKKPR